jgi:hypothetical protein
MIILNNLNKIQEKVFDIFVIISYILVIASYLGLSIEAKPLLLKIDNYVKIYICLFLIWRFNPLRSRYEFTNLDRKIAFTSGIFILTTSLLTNYLAIIENRLKSIKNYLEDKWSNADSNTSS